MRLLNLFLLIFFLFSIKSYSLPPCEGDSPIWNKCVGTYTFSNGDKYVGEFKYNAFHGKGTYTFADGKKYVGGWKDGNKNGKGTIIFPDGKKYVSEWKNGLELKKSTVVYSKDKSKSCEGDDFKKWNNCYGIYVWILPLEKAMTDKRIKYEESVEYQMIQEGSLWNAYGPRGFKDFEDYIKRNKRVSNIFESKEKILSKSLEPLIFIPNEGDKYEGDWKDGMLHGKGTYTWAVGHKYVGEWKNGKMHGKGTYTLPNGEKYEGKWRDGKFIR